MVTLTTPRPGVGRMKANNKNNTDIFNLVSAGAPARYVKWHLLARQHATSPSQSFASTVRLLPQPTAASSTSPAVASRKSRDLFIRFNLQLINFKVFHSYIRSIKCIIRSFRAVIKACKNLKCSFMYFVLFLKYIHL